MLNQRRNYLLWGSDICECIRNNKGLQSSQRIERHLGDLALRKLLNVHAPAMGQCHCRRAELCRISYGEVDLMLCRDTALEGDTVRLGDGIAVAMFDEVEPLFLLQCSLEVR